MPGLPQKNDPVVKETSSTFQLIMLDILQRRVVFEGLEYRMIQTGIKEGETTHILLAADYTRSQLADLRKFFDTDGRSYRMSDLLPHLAAGGPAHSKYDSLKVVWDRDYKETANKYFFHRDRGFTPPAGFSRAALDSFIDEMNILLNYLVKELTAANFVIEYVVRDKDISFFQEVKRDAVSFFRDLSEKTPTVPPKSA